ncbi:MAG: hypothetical protein HGA45_22010 [Chloroflexales bacterium]|nr:hypothetical protein [Chloroflexales bacterium]
MNRFVIALALCLLALGGCAVVAPPPAQGELTITLDTEPARPVAGSAATLAITAASGGQPLLGARVLVVRRILGVDHPGDDIIFESDEQGGGRYAATTTFAEGGRWDVQVVVTPSTGEAHTATFVVEVAQP